MLNISKFHFTTSTIRAEQAFHLHYGRAGAALAWVGPDLRWPGMWRITWPDGRTSDIINLARAKDAAEAICERGPPARDRKLFHWKASNSPSRAPPIAPIPLTQPPGSPRRNYRAGGARTAWGAAMTVQHHTITVSNADKAMMLRIERFILGYNGDDLLHDIELAFPSASYRAFYLAYMRAARWLPEGNA
jgi:hypothetical protein